MNTKHSIAKKRLQSVRIFMVFILLAALFFGAVIDIESFAETPYESAVATIDARNPIAQKQLYRYNEDFTEKITGICNVSSMVTLLNRRLAYDGIDSSFTPRDVLTSLGCTEIKNDGAKYYYKGDTGAWFNKTYSNGSYSYKSVSISAATVKKKTDDAGFYQYIAELLQEHPEGLAIRNTKAQHVAVIYKFEYINNSVQLYMKDPVNNYSGKLENSYLYKESGKNLYNNLQAIVYISGSTPASADIDPPVISNVQVSDISSSGYTVTCNVSDNVGVTSVRFPSWSDQNGQDDLVPWPWPEGSLSNGMASYRVNVSDHNGENNCYYTTYIYAYDAAGNGVEVTNSQNNELHVFVPGATYTYQFDAYGGTGEIQNVETHIGDPITFPKCTFTREGYSFQGWVACRINDGKYPTSAGWQTDEEIIQKGLEKTIYPDELSFTFNTSWTDGIDGSCTFKMLAVWKPITYTYTFDSYGGIGEMAPIETHIGDPIAFPKCTFTREGYSFQGWVACRINDGKYAIEYVGWRTDEEIVQEGLEKTIYPDELSFIFNTSWIEGIDGPCTIKLLAVWKPITYTYTFDSYGGIGEMAPIETHIGDPIAFPKCTFTREGYSFQGWVACRINDGKYAIEYVGWRTDEEIVQEGLEKTIYPDELSFIFNTSWTEGIDGPCTIKLLAVWKKLLPDYILPSSLMTIEEEAFCGGAFTYVQVPAKVTGIGAYAFADCPNLRNIDIQGMDTRIDPTAFDGVDDLTIHGLEGSYAEFFADKYDFPFVVIGD